MAVVTIGGNDVVVRPAARHRSNRDCFLPDVEVQEAADLLHLILLLRLLLEPPDHEHVVQQLQVGTFLLGFVHWKMRGRGGADLGRGSVEVAYSRTTATDEAGLVPSRPRRKPSCAEAMN